MLFIQPLRYLLQAEVWILPLIAQYNSFTKETGVLEGWKAMRDLSNMFFVLILLVIAFATILRFQKYGYKQLLSKYLLMAILINFSMTITGLLIDLSQIVMLTFVSAIKDVAAGNIIVSLGLYNIMRMNPTDAEFSSTGYIASMIFGAIMMAITVIVVGVVIIMLALRIVALWILVVVSPLAFASFTFPKAKEKLWDRWLNTLTNYLISGPLLVFFVWLAFTITGSGNINKEFIKFQPPGGGPGEELSRAATTDQIINFIIAITMLVGGLAASASSGVAGASVAGAAKGLIDRSAAGVRKRLLVGASGAGGLKGLGIGAAATGARLAGGVATGVGSLRRILPQTTRDAIGRTYQRAADVPLAGRAIRAAGVPFRTIASLQQQVVGAGEAARSQRVAYEQKRVESLPSDRQASIIGLRAAGVFGGDARGAQLLREGKDEFKSLLSSARTAQERAAILNQVRDTERRLRKGGAKEQDLAGQLRQLDPTLLTADDHRTIARKGGAAKAMSDMSFHNAAQNFNASGNIDENTSQLFEQLFRGDLKKIKSFLEDLSDAEKENLRPLIQNYAENRFDRDDLFTTNGAINRNAVNSSSDSYKLMATVANLRPAQANAIYTRATGSGALTNNERDVLARRLSNDVEVKNIVRIPQADELFRNIATQANQSKATEIAKESDALHTQGLVQARIAAGDIKSILDNPVLARALPAPVLQTQITNYFSAQVAAGADENQLGKQYLEHAHLIFGNNMQSLVNFINSLKLQEAAKMDKAALRSAIQQNRYPVDPELVTGLRQYYSI